MSQPVLRMFFYLIAGSILAFITWGSVEHSVVTGDHILAIIVMGMMFFIVGKFFVDRWRPVYGPDAFHPDRLWKMPQTATRRELWYRVGFSTFVGATTFTVIASGLVLTTTAEPPFMILLGSLLALRIPYLYWSMRSRYEPITNERGNGIDQPELRYKGGSGLHGATFWLIPALMASLGTLIAVIGLQLH